MSRDFVILDLQCF